MAGKPLTINEWIQYYQTQDGSVPNPIELLTVQATNFVDHLPPTSSFALFDLFLEPLLFLLFLLIIIVLDRLEGISSIVCVVNHVEDDDLDKLYARVHGLLKIGLRHEVNYRTEFWQAISDGKPPPRIRCKIQNLDTMQHFISAFSSLAMSHLALHEIETWILPRLGIKVPNNSLPSFRARPGTHFSP